MFCKKVFLKILRNSQEGTCARVSFLINVTFFNRTPQGAASENLKWFQFPVRRKILHYSPFTAHKKLNSRFHTCKATNYKDKRLTILEVHMRKHEKRKVATKFRGINEKWAIRQMLSVVKMIYRFFHKLLIWNIEHLTCFFYCISLPQKCPYSEFFWPVLSRIREIPVFAQCLWQGRERGALKLDPFP